VLAALVFAAWSFRDRPMAASGESVPAKEAGPFAKIEDLLWRGDVEGVRQGLMSLPAELSDSQDARALQIRMHIESARYDLAQQKLAAQMDAEQRAKDPVWRARLLTLQTMIIARQGISTTEVFNPAHDAVTLLEGLGDKAPPSVLAEALSARGDAYVRLQEYDLGIRDLIRARDIQLTLEDKRLVTNTRLALAFAWIRIGRLEKALEEYIETARISRQLHYLRGEVDSLNAATRIQIELLRWEDALENSRNSMNISSNVPDSNIRMYSIRLHALVLTNLGRLREAAALLEQSDTGTKPGSISSITHSIETGSLEKALKESAASFASYDNTTNTFLILSSREGCLLLWMIAAQEQAAAGGVMPEPNPAQIEALRQPMSIPGRIARGRWLSSRGLNREAEDELRTVFDDAEKEGRLYYMTLAAEPLIDLLLANKNVDDASVVISSLRGIDPDRMDRDYRVAALRLRTALAKNDLAEMQEAYRIARSLAGERRLRTEASPAKSLPSPDALSADSGL
jgi:tetratricopeptide (TPR) repeat protein